MPVASSEVLGAGSHLSLDPGCCSPLVLIPLALPRHSFPTCDAITVSCRPYVPLLVWWRQILFLCFLIKNERDHIDEGSSHGGNEELHGLVEHVCAQQALGCPALCGDDW